MILFKVVFLIMFFAALAKFTEFVQANLTGWGVTSYSGESVLFSVAMLIAITAAVKTMACESECCKGH